jgi:hypothetical protein
MLVLPESGCVSEEEFSTKGDSSNEKDEGLSEQEFPDTEGS